MDEGWSELPSDLIEDIARRLTVYVDYVRFRAVCVKWCSSTPPKPDYLVNQFPWLMISPESELDLPYGEHHDFYNLFENKVHRLNMRPNDRPWRRCCGSSHGWLVLLEERGPAILLYNPITRVQIHLPPITTFQNVLDFNIHKVGQEYLFRSPYGENPTRLSVDEMHDTFFKKVVLSTNPTSLDEDYIAVAILGRSLDLAFCKKGDEGWTVIKNSIFYDDVIYYEGVFYAVRHDGTLASFDVTDPSPSMKVINLPTTPVFRRDVDYCEKLYLVDSFGELLMVQRLFRGVHVIRNQFRVYTTNGFEVVKLNSSKTKWVKVETLKDRMLFLGTSSSLCLLATDFSGCDGNCIYFAGESNKVPYNNSYCNHDSGVFSLGDGSITELPNCTVNGETFFPPPLWLTPNPC